MQNFISEDFFIDDSFINLKEKLQNIPSKPGVYLYKNSQDKIIYVGKAKILRNRVRSYFQQGKPLDPKTKAMVGKIADLDYFITDSEAEALILENTLIKKHKPRYNIMLKDDKSYPFIRLTNEEYPRLFSTRKVIKDGSKYFGPFTELGTLKNLMRVLRTLFRFRTCKLNINQQTIEKKKFKVCLDYHIKKCDGPCEGLIPRQEYLDNVNQAIQIINGKTKDIEKKLLAQMEELAEEMKFEEAAIVRNRYNQLKEYLSHQKILSTDSLNRDIFGISRIDELACALIFKIREGKLTGKRHFIITNAVEQTDESLIQTVLEKWFLETDFIPKEVFLPCMPEQSDFLLTFVKEKLNRSLELIVPKLGDKKSFVQMANINAEFMLRDYLIALTKREQTVPRVLHSLQRDLKLKKPPVRIECFDNSHIQGSELVSSLVVFENAKPKKSDYRKFKNKTVGHNDDFAAMREVVSRRYTRLLEEKSQLPDLIIVDGGKGQLSSAVAVLKELDLYEKIPIIGLAKRIDEIFIPNQSESILLPKTSSSLKVIQQLRDEAHRFAITFHRELREKRTIKTELTNIEGIGEKTAQKLLITFGSVEQIRSLSVEELSKEVSEKSAKKIAEYFKNKEE